MSSVMATGGVERNAATLLWWIENLNYYDPKIHDTEICSPHMTIRTLEIEHCSLFLKLDNRDTRLSLYIEQKLDFSIDCDFSLLAADESVIISRIIRNRKIRGPARIKMPNFPTHKEMFQTKKSKFLPCDTLRVRCQIWKSSGSVPVSEIIFASSQIKVSENCFLWDVQAFKDTQTFKNAQGLKEGVHSALKTAHIVFSNASQELQDFESMYFLTGDSLYSANFGFSISLNFILEPLLMRMKVSMLGDRQETVTLFDAKHTFMESDKCCPVSQCSLTKAFQKKMEKFRCSENLNILVHFTAVHQQLQEFHRSYIGTSCIEYNNAKPICRPSFVEMSFQISQESGATIHNARIISSPEFREASCQTSQQNGETAHNAGIISSPKYTETSCQTSQSGDTTHGLQRVSDSVDMLIEDFHAMYCDQTLSDFELCSGDVTFHVHKNILSARSPVFKAMFSSNMKESSSQSLDIPDLDSHTLNRLLSFLYTGSIEADLHVMSAAKLYYAADKYEVNWLKCQCVSILKTGTSVSNISDILVLADKHQDEELMTFVDNFILSHFNEVMRSEEWGKFLEIDPYLAATTVRKICTRM